MSYVSRLMVVLLTALFSSALFADDEPKKDVTTIQVPFIDFETKGFLQTYNGTIVDNGGKPLPKYIRVTENSAPFNEEVKYFNEKAVDLIIEETGTDMIEPVSHVTDLAEYEHENGKDRLCYEGRAEKVPQILKNLTDGVVSKAVKFTDSVVSVGEEDGRVITQVEVFWQHKNSNGTFGTGSYKVKPCL